MDRKQLILIVDDERAIRDLLADALEDDGYLVARADDGWSALRIAVDRRPDLIITDIMMPGLDGRSFVQRARERGVDAPVIFISAVYSPRETPASLSFMKPFDLDDLLAAVESLLSADQRSIAPSHPATSRSLRERLTPPAGIFSNAGAMARAR